MEKVTKLRKKVERVEILKRKNSTLKKEMAKLEDTGKMKGLAHNLSAIKTKNEEIKFSAAQGS